MGGNTQGGQQGYSSLGQTPQQPAFNPYAQSAAYGGGNNAPIQESPDYFPLLIDDLYQRMKARAAYDMPEMGWDQSGGDFSF